MIINQIFETQEKVIRKVNPSGNGAHVFVPKEWIGEDVMLVRISKSDIKKEVIKLLEPYMEEVVSVLLFGSYARGEQNTKSDIDIMVIAKKPFKLKEKGMDIIIIPEDKIESAIRINPIMLYSAIIEGKPIINSSFFEKLKAKRINRESFRDFYDTSLLSLNVDREIIEMDKEQGKKEAANSVLYSLFLRLRGMFIIRCIINKKPYSNSLFREWMVRTIKNLDYDSFYTIYVSVREDNKTSCKVDINIAEDLLKLLESEVKEYD